MKLRILFVIASMGYAYAPCFANDPSTYFPPNKVASLNECNATTDSEGKVTLSGISGGYAGEGHILIVPAQERCHKSDGCPATFTICSVDPKGLTRATTNPDVDIGTIGSGWSTFAPWQDPNQIYRRNTRPFLMTRHNLS